MIIWWWYMYEQLCLSNDKLLYFTMCCFEVDISLFCCEKYFPLLWLCDCFTKGSALLLISWYCRWWYCKLHRVSTFNIGQLCSQQVFEIVKENEITALLTHIRFCFWLFYKAETKFGYMDSRCGSTFNLIEITMELLKY